MPRHRMRRFLGRLAGPQLLWWCVVGVLLAALQPFLAVHFRDGGWEDEPGFRIRAVGATAQFEPDERPDHAHSPETTVFVASSASTDLPNVFQHGLDGLMALVLALLPLRVARCAFCVPDARAVRERVHAISRAPPAAHRWHRCPPKTAPPLTT